MARGTRPQDRAPAPPPPADDLAADLRAFAAVVDKPTPDCVVCRLPERATIEQVASESGLGRRKWRNAREWLIRRRGYAVTEDEAKATGRPLAPSVAALNAHFQRGHHHAAKPEA